MEMAETEFFSDKSNPLFNWNAQTISDTLKTAGLTVTAETRLITENRRISADEIRTWFDQNNSSYGSFMAKSLGNTETEKIAALLRTAAPQMVFNWETEIVFLTVSS